MPTYNLTVVDQDTILVTTVPDVPIALVRESVTTVVSAPAGQGPPGPQNLFVGPTPPPSPYVGLVWADTS